MSELGLSRHPGTGLCVNTASGTAGAGCSGHHHPGALPSLGGEWARGRAGRAGQGAGKRHRCVGQRDGPRKKRPALFLGSAAVLGGAAGVGFAIGITSSITSRSISHRPVVSDRTENPQRASRNQTPSMHYNQKPSQSAKQRAQHHSPRGEATRHKTGSGEWESTRPNTE